MDIRFNVNGKWIEVTLTADEEKSAYRLALEDYIKKLEKVKKVYPNLSEAVQIALTEKITQHAHFIMERLAKEKYLNPKNDAAAPAAPATTNTDTSSANKDGFDWK